MPGNNIYSKPLPEILTSLVLDCGIEWPPSKTRAIKGMNVGQQIVFYAELWTYTIRRDK
jgi:hypothetical protein